MVLNIKHSPQNAELNWLASHKKSFLKVLRKQGYAERTLQTHRLMTERLCAWVQELGITREELDATTLNECAMTCPLTGSASMAQKFTWVTDKFIDFLIETGAITERSAEALSEPTFLIQLGLDLDHWLCIHRGMYGRRLRTHQNVLNDFVLYCTDDSSVAETLYAVMPEQVYAYLDHLSGKIHWRVPYLRNIFRFLFWRGLTAHDLSESIPSVAQGKSGNAVCHLDTETVDKLLAAVRGDSAREVRDYAMLLMMARLGLRAQEVIALRLDDIDWRNGVMKIRSKGGQLDSMPLPVDVGEALVEWICNARKGDSRHVFVSVYAPFQRMESSLIIRNALSIACQRAGLNSPHDRVRTHTLRHSLAMSLLKQDQSLQEVGNVLRHRCQQSTTVYVRYDIDALRPLARPWPTETGAVR